jgi:hypothetical protein
MKHEEFNPIVGKAHLTTLNLNNFKMMEAMGLKIIASRSHLNDINSVLNFMKLYQAFQKLLVGTQTVTQTDRLMT